MHISNTSSFHSQESKDRIARLPFTVVEKSPGWDLCAHDSVTKVHPQPSYWNGLRFKLFNKTERRRKRRLAIQMILPATGL